MTSDLYVITRDAIIACIVNTLINLLTGVLVFSLLGNSHYSPLYYSDSFHIGPGFTVITYPLLVRSLPGPVILAIIFFVMVLVLHINTQFCCVEALVTGIVDNWPDQLLKHRRLFTIILCTLLACLGLPLVTNVSFSQ